MESTISKPIGSDVQDLDTPSLTVDLDVFEENRAAKKTLTMH